MPFNTEIRNKLASMVGNARRLLRKEFQEQLQELYGIQPDGRITPIQKLTHLDDEQLAVALLLRQGIEYLESSGVHEENPTQTAINRFLNEQSFTVLNRFAALRLCEERGIIQESLRNCVQSKGFQVYLKIAGSGIGDRFQRYKTFLLCLYDEIAVDLGILFDRFSKEGLLFPREQAFLKLLELINNTDLDNIWSEDETLGWIYQYFNSNEERKKMRMSSSAPQNSHELAVRNQFFTPRYVVQFLTENTLGRTWYEMQKGETRLVKKFNYLVRRPNEIFLNKDESSPEQEMGNGDFSLEELLKQPVYIPYRAKKDPREIKILDPACGSGHFLLYAFDLLETIYEEAWEDEDIGEQLHQDFQSLENYRKAISSLILEHNLYGVDIDARCAQIGSLALWLRAQRAYMKLNLPPAERPKIKKTNIVIAEPMPGNKELLKEFTAKLDSPTIGQLVKIVFDKMQLAGEAGSLLKIEMEIQSAVSEAKVIWKQRPETEQLKLFKNGIPKMEQTKLPFDFSGITDLQFWEKAEEQIYAALHDYAEQTETRNIERRLFAEDVVRGFAFIDLFKNHYDVVLMNPPFGLPSPPLMDGIRDRKLKKSASKNLAWAFIDRAAEVIFTSGFIGAIVDRTIFQKSSYMEFRSDTIYSNSLKTYVDLGAGVLEANVFTSCFSLMLGKPVEGKALFIDTRFMYLKNRASYIKEIIDDVCLGRSNNKYQLRDPSEFRIVPFFSLAYWIKKSTLENLFQENSLADHAVEIGGGLQCNDVFRFTRNFWEVLPTNIRQGKWHYLYNGGDYSKYWLALTQLVNWQHNGREIKENIVKLGHSPSRHVVNERLYFKSGLAGGERGEFFDVHCMPKSMIFSNEGRAFFCDMRSSFFLLGYMNTLFAQQLVNIFCGQHKGADYLKRLPLPEGLFARQDEIAELTREIVNNKMMVSQLDETSLTFCCYGVDVSLNKMKSIKHMASYINNFIKKRQDFVRRKDDEIRCVISNKLGEDVVLEIENSGWTESPPPEDRIENVSPNVRLYQGISNLTGSILCFLIGCIYGRWDIRFAIGQKRLPELPNPFLPLLICPLGTLKNDSGLPSERRDIPSDYPLQVSWGGILVDDPSHKDDIVHRIRETLNIIWGDKADSIEHEACQLLKVKSICEYFRNPNNFFSNHLKNYSKSRRQAPIYWPISSKSGSFTLWIYYHRLTDQTLFSCVADFVNPKINTLSKEIERVEKGIADDSIQKQREEYEELQDLRQELIDFRNDLLSITKLPYKPDLNDGVMITASPLWKLFRNKKWSQALKACWHKLEIGKNDWAHLAYSIWPERVKEKCKIDKSLAIAHELEDLYEGSH